MPLPGANAALDDLDTKGWKPLRHGSPESMWPQSNIKASALPGKWQLAPSSFLSASPFSSRVEGEAMAPGAMNLLSAGRTPLVVTVIRNNLDQPFERGQLVVVTEFEEGPTSLVHIEPLSLITEEAINDALEDQAHKYFFGYTAVISAAVESDQEEVALSVGGVDLVRYTKDDYTCLYSNSVGYSLDTWTDQIGIGTEMRPGLIPLTKPVINTKKDVAIFSAYIEPHILTHLNKSRHMGGEDPEKTTPHIIIVLFQNSLRTHYEQQGQTDDHKHQGLNNCLVGFTVGDSDNMFQVNTYSAACAAAVTEGNKLYDAYHGPWEEQVEKFGLKDPHGNPLTKEKYLRYLQHGTFYKIVPSNLEELEIDVNPDAAQRYSTVEGTDIQTNLPEAEAEDPDFAAL